MWNLIDKYYFFIVWSEVLLNFIVELKEVKFVVKYGLVVKIDWNIEFWMNVIK